MKPRLFKLALFLILGAIVNVAVAGTIWKREPFSHKILGMVFQTTAIEDSYRDLWSRNRRETWPIDPSSNIGLFHGMCINVVSLTNRNPVSQNALPGKIRCHVWRTEIGWPCRTIAIEAAYEIHDGPIAGFFSEEHNGMTIEGNLFPRDILWKGFVFNTTIYTCSGLILLALPGFIRRVIRAKRGHCIKCGYDLRETSGGCPECGWGREAEA